MNIEIEMKKISNYMEQEIKYYKDIIELNRKDESNVRDILLSDKSDSDKIIELKKIFIHEDGDIIF